MKVSREQAALVDPGEGHGRIETGGPQEAPGRLSAKKGRSTE